MSRYRCYDELRVTLDYDQWRDLRPLVNGTSGRDIVLTQGGSAKGYWGDDFIVDGDSVEFNIAPEFREADPVVYGAGGGDSRLAGGAGDDVIMAGDGNDVVFAGDGDDVVAGDAVKVTDSGYQWAFYRSRDILDRSQDILYVSQVDANAGADQLYGGPGHDRMHGGGGNDHIQGGPGDDVLVGGDGNDTLVPGEGLNFLLGGDGADTFDLRESIDSFNYIIDFNAREGDKVLLPSRYELHPIPTYTSDVAEWYIEEAQLHTYGQCSGTVIDTDWGSFLGLPEGWAFFLGKMPETLEQYDVFIA